MNATQIKLMLQARYAESTDPAERAALVTEIEACRQAEVAELKKRLAWYESDEALELFRTGRMMYPEVTVACLRNNLALLEG